MEQTQYNMLFRWFVGPSMDDTVWVPTVFTKNRQRLIEHDAVVAFFNEVIETADKTCDPCWVQDKFAALAQSSQTSGRCTRSARVSSMARKAEPRRRPASHSLVFGVAANSAVC